MIFLPKSMIAYYCKKRYTYSEEIDCTGMGGRIFMTLKEIASRAGVSVSTVSRIINSPDDSFASKKVRDRVWAIVKETEYVPNPWARALRQPNDELVRSHTIACIYGRSKTSSDNPFFANIARAMEQQALSMGYVISCTYSIYDVQEKDFLQCIPSNVTEGAIVLGRFNSNIKNLLKKRYKNLVYTGLNYIDAEWDQVVCDGYDAAETALMHLIRSGHRHIGYIGETDNEIRFEAYKAILQREGIRIDWTVVSDCLQDSSGGYQGAEKLVKSAAELPTAVFCANDTTAIAALKRFSELGISIPKKMSLISIDDIEMAQYVTPMLTSVAVPKEELGKMAVQTLIGRINKGHRLPVKIVLPHKLIIRESTAHI